MLSIDYPLPSISITPASPENVYPEPYSPIPSAKLDVEDDGYRAKWLSLPPLADTSLWHSSPLRPADCPPHKGLSQDQFNSLLKVSRDQRTSLGTQKKPDLCKELALKRQALKQLERRAHFLSKVREPSRTATIVISTLEDSLEPPMNAHCPNSPYRFESEFSALEVAATNLVVVKSPTNPENHEQVERGPPITKQLLTNSMFPCSLPRKSRRITPSLDEITARLKPVHVSSTRDCPRSRLPHFLKALGSPPKTIPVRSFALNDEKFDTTFAQQVIPSQHPDPCTLKLGLRRVVISRTANTVAGPTLHTSRADTARDMIVTLRRRSSPPPGLGRHEYTRTAVEVKRRSAPAELQHNIGLDRVAMSWGDL